MVASMMSAIRGKRVLVFEDGRIKWTGRKVVRGVKKKGGEGYPILALPVELRSWIGRVVEIEQRSEEEIVVRLVGGDEE